MNAEAIGKQIMVLGLIVLCLGAAIWLSGKMNFSLKLPGDIVFKRGNTTFYFPLASSILLSILLTAVLWLYRYFSSKA